MAADGGLITLETPHGIKWLSRKPGHFIDWNISPSQTYVVRGTRTGIHGWMSRHAGYTVSSNQGPLYMQVRKLGEPLGKQLQKAYGGAVLGGTPISAVTGLVNVGATSANAFGAGASAVGELATNAAVLGSEVVQMAYDEGLDAVKGPGKFARGLDKLGLRDKYHVYFTSSGPKHSTSQLPKSTRQFPHGQSYDFAFLAGVFLTLKP